MMRIHSFAALVRSVLERLVEQEALPLTSAPVSSAELLGARQLARMIEEESKEMIDRVDLFDEQSQHRILRALRFTPPPRRIR
jgi:hypothetical protein